MLAVPPKRSIHYSPPRAGEELACLRLENRDKSAEGHVSAIFGLLGGGEPPFAVTGCKVVDIGLQLTISFERKKSPRRFGCKAITKRRNETVEGKW